MRLKRNIEEYLKQQIKELINDKSSKTLIVDGIKGVGKTTLLKNVLEDVNLNYIILDLHKNYELVNLIKSNEIQKLVSYLKSNFSFNDKLPLIVFDESHYCIEIISLIKTLKQNCPEIKTIISGSYLLSKVNCENINELFNIIKINPLTFEEFVINLYPNVHNDIIDVLKTKDLKTYDSTLKRKWTNIFYEYLLVGGMPHYVSSFIDFKNSNQLYKTEHNWFLKNKNHIIILKEDIKHLFKSNIDIKKSLSIFDSIFKQLNKTNKRFMLTEVNIENRDNKNNKYRDFKDVLLKLKLSKIVNFAYYLKDLNEPFSDFVDQSKFKIYYPDFSFLTSLYEIKISDILSSSKLWIIIKNEVFENFLFNEIHYLNDELLNDFLKIYTYNKDNLKIDFLTQYKSNEPTIINFNYCKKSNMSFVDKLKRKLEKFKYIDIVLNDFVIDDSSISLPIFLIGYFYKNVLLDEDKN